ncbi:MAG: PAS domain S-box protein [Bacteroidota bacterium]|nr:PAS domain S-box protein [Bacteroidota bacterium]MDP3145942.1 PAS domain S-box protein [Bacteroidota bacterium]
MTENIFPLGFDRWNVTLLSFIPVLINLLIFSYSIFKLNKNRTNNYFSLFVFILLLWQASVGLTRLSINISDAENWYRVSEKIVLFVVLFGNLFIFSITGLYKKISDSLIFFALILPAILMYLCIDLKLDEFEIVVSETWYWNIKPIPNIFTSLNYIWVSFGGILMLLSLWYSYLKFSNDTIKREQIYILAIGFTIPISLGIITEIVFPMFLGREVIPLTASLVTAFSIVSIISISKYKMFNYSPKSQWQQIIETMNEGILIVNNDDEIMYANPAFCKESGYNFEEMDGRIASDFLLENEGDKQRIKNNIELRKADVSDQFELEMKTKSGKNIWMLVSATPYKNYRGEVIGSIGIHANITEIKTANKSLENSNAELELYIYKASHDLRSPLASILGLITIWKPELKDENSINYIKMIETTAKKLDNTLSELVKTMKVKGIKNFEDKINFEELIDDILNKFSHYPGFERLQIQKDINITSEFISSKFIVDTILQNLIENAIKYQNTSIQNPFIQISINDIGEQLKITITDNGIGINEASQAKVFDMYYRGTNDSKGSGLGLYLVKKSLEKLQGEIVLKSNEGVGTEVTVFLKR